VSNTYSGMMNREEEPPIEDKPYASTSVADENLSTRGHIDPDKHWIGEALPSPSIGEIKPSGVATHTGYSPFVARADHAHDNKSYYGIFNGAGMTINPGQVFINNLTFLNGRNMLAPGSQQIVLFPIEGVWETIFQMRATRDGGGLFRGECNIVFFYNNGGYGREVHRVSMYDVPSYVTFTALDHVHYSAPSNATNIQVAIQHNDIVTWTVTTMYMEVRRISSYGSA